MRPIFLVLTVKKLLKSVYIYGSYRKIKTGLSLFWTTLYVQQRLLRMHSLNPLSFDALFPRNPSEYPHITLPYISRN